MFSDTHHITSCSPSLSNRFACTHVFVCACRFVPSSFIYRLVYACVRGHADQMGFTLRNICAEFIFILFYSFWLILFSPSNWELTTAFDAFIRKISTLTKQYTHSHQTPHKSNFFTKKNGIFRLYLSKIILQLANSSKSIWYSIIFLFPLFQTEEGEK